jgi:polygalacturonase
MFLRAVALLLVAHLGRSLDLSLEARCPDASKRFDAKTLGAKANGVTNDRDAIQKAIDLASVQRGCAVLSPGIFLSGGLLMKPHVTLYISQGAILRASTDGRDYVSQMNTPNISRFVRGHLVGANAAHHSKVIGEGVIDGQCQQFLTGLGHTFDDGCPPGGCSPQQFTFNELQVPGHGSIRVGVVAFADSIDVAVEGVTITDSHAWTAAFFNVTDLLIRRVNVYGDWRMPNNDGIDICSSANVLIDHVNIDTGDDCITSKTNVQRVDGTYVPLRNLTVRNSRLRSRSFGVKVGTETHGDMSDILFDNIQIHNSHHGIGIDWRGMGHFTNATFSNINFLRMSWVGSGSYKQQNWMGAAQSISITNKGGSLLNPNETTGEVAHVLFENVTSVSENSAVYISACTEHGNSTYDSHGNCTRGLGSSIHDISFVNVVAIVEQLPSNNASNGPHSSHDDTTGMRIPAPVDAFFVEMATDVSFKGCSAAFSGAPSVSRQCVLHKNGKETPDPSGCPNSFGRCIHFGPGVQGTVPELSDCTPPVAHSARRVTGEILK